MTHSYKISGMTCNSCVGTVQNLLSSVNGVDAVKVDLQKGEATIDMAQHVQTAQLKDALKEYPKYELTEATVRPPAEAVYEEVEEGTRSWFQTYKPVMLIFAYLTGITLLIEGVNGSFNWMRWMNHFMGGFFLVFSFFKMLNLAGFAESYRMYDILAKRFGNWGYIYPFVELGLGVAFLMGIAPIVTNAVTLVVMAISIIGVLQSVLNKRKIKCACLGDVFNLPMSTITIIEDAVMIVMSLLMLVSML